MDLKSVIKTFAEAWAAASLKLERGGAGAWPGLAWPAPPPPSLLDLHRPGPALEPALPAQVGSRQHELGLLCAESWRGVLGCDNSG